MNIFQSFQINSAIRKLENLDVGLKKDEEFEKARQPIVDQLVQFGQPAVEPLLRILKSNGRPRFRESVFETLGRIGDERSVDPLIQLIMGKANADTAPVANALGQIGDKRALDVLKSIVNKGTSADRRAWRAAAGAYEKISGENLNTERNRVESIWSQEDREEAERAWGEGMRQDGSSLL